MYIPRHGRVRDGVVEAARSNLYMNAGPLPGLAWEGSHGSRAGWTRYRYSPPRPWLDRRAVEHTAPAAHQRPYGMMSMASVGPGRRAQEGISRAKHTVPGQRQCAAQTCPAPAWIPPSAVTQSRRVGWLSEGRRPRMASNRRPRAANDTPTASQMGAHPPANACGCPRRQRPAGAPGRDLSGRGGLGWRRP